MISLISTVTNDLFDINVKQYKISVDMTRFILATKKLFKIAPDAKSIYKLVENKLKE